ncbi:Hpt domain-containing protein [uncultured Fibrobacter sp.]|uniref:Hpt domain-containing protein n=1 Tax=uncultured Fibrobacter sp. TaxID=261512 RepID=UPI0025D72293|nr:Hpt domain-containing protein [uncultured Fibrobacter sp.]
MITIEKLNSFGANVTEGLARCFGNEALFLKLVMTIPDDAVFDRLKQKLETKDLDGAFDAAHALKGVLGNLSLTPLYTVAVEMTELLRNRTQMDYGELLAKLFEKRDELGKLCNE